MLIGSGMLAQVFAPSFAQSGDVCIYAAGVSNSGCTNAGEFARERLRLAEALEHAKQVGAFVYFGTCSVTDPEAQSSPYVLHKLAMEHLVSVHPHHLIIRLPQIAGETSNPHTLLNYLYARIARSESFSLWKNAKRNIIDIEDVVATSTQLIADKAARNRVFNIANPVNYPMTEIVAEMENALGKQAIYDLVERGTEYPVDTSAILPVLNQAKVKFGAGYLEHVIRKYYGKPQR